MKFLVSIFFASILFLSASDVEARGVAIYNTGEDIVHVSDVAEEMVAEVEEAYAPNLKIGMIYSRFGLFWMDIWRWESRWVLYDNDSYVEIEKEVLEKYAGAELKKPLSMTLPLGLIVLIVAVLGYGIVMFLTRGDDDEENEAPAQG